MEYDKYVEAVAGAARMLGDVVRSIEACALSIPRQSLMDYVEKVEKHAKVDGVSYKLLLRRKTHHDMACLVEYVFILHDKKANANVMHMRIETSMQGEPVRFSLSYDKGMAPDHSALALYRLAGEMRKNVNAHMVMQEEVEKNDCG